jgi:hypothetical protein
MRAKAPLATIMAFSLALAATAVSADEDATAPEATVRVSGGSVGLGLGYVWGGGVLSYRGKEYKFRIDGISTGAVGAANIDVTGEIYHLKEIETFAGTYAGFTAAATVGGGVNYSALQNGSGVYIELRGTGMGMLFQAGPSGIRVVMESEQVTSR